MASLLEPVEAYDRIAPEFSRISEVRGRYLAAVERLVCAHVPHGAQSLLDVGAGDGSRSQRIADACGIQRVVLVEPSAEMRRRCSSAAVFLGIRAEELGSVAEQFDVIVSLWNVLGHLTTAAARQLAMTQFARLLKPDGLAFVDVNHRYNALHYGLVKTALRSLHDIVRPGESNGDVVARWHLANEECATYGHVFTDSEVRKLAERAGLIVKKRFAVDYATGRLRRSSLLGHLLYCFEKAH